jgi:hypothetical protein
MFEQMVLEVFLFFAVFSFLCCLQFSPKPYETPQPIEQQLKEAFTLMDEIVVAPPETPVEESQPAIVEITPDNQNHTSAPTRRKSTGRATKKVGKSTSTEHLAALEGIDLDRLPLRPARKVCQAVGLPQKVSGKNLPVVILRRNIQARLQEEPGLVQIVAEVLSA